jgi:hypothetical protein
MIRFFIDLVIMVMVSCVNKEYRGGRRLIIVGANIHIFVFTDLERRRNK